MTSKPQNQIHDSYVHGQKMCASMTYLFGQILGLVSGKMTGNPSISEQVSSYMMSLWTCKATHAITSETLKKLYNENNKPENSKIKVYEPSLWSQAADIDDWGGGITRRALQAIYTIAFLCLLCSDELHDDDSITLTLDFWKTHHDGGIKPFHIYPLPWDEAHLCPVHALGKWIKASKITSGYLFWKMASGDRPDADDKPMTSEQFLELFQNNLLNIRVDPIPYRTHSFRCGGCQYLSSVWCCTEFSNFTIVCYFISRNDNPTDKHEDYFNPAQKPAIKCFQCGRSCHCA
ncbi:hypothetical protein CPB84DRAFT_1815663 [Gymnopilus junonius]|uniref:Uncharacterized protein n=1 Tax=Gymnopilus junonius TaxID=109634 RepID=A0A9P5NLP6_GYMJU|nr:hypothetical protein CPB84DRAFT_1815663 [Gymnopilus junonius]